MICLAILRKARHCFSLIARFFWMNGVIFRAKWRGVSLSAFCVSNASGFMESMISWAIFFCWCLMAKWRGVSLFTEENVLNFLEFWIAVLACFLMSMDARRKLSLRIAKWRGVLPLMSLALRILCGAFFMISFTMASVWSVAAIEWIARWSGVLLGSSDADAWVGWLMSALELSRPWISSVLLAWIARWNGVRPWWSYWDSKCLILRLSRCYR